MYWGFTYKFNQRADMGELSRGTEQKVSIAFWTREGSETSDGRWDRTEQKVSRSFWTREE